MRPWLCLRSFFAEEAAVAEESKEQDPAARSDSAAEAAFAKEELKDPSADELANDGEDEESVNDALSTVYGDSVIDEEELVVRANARGDLQTADAHLGQTPRSLTIQMH